MKDDVILITGGLGFIGSKLEERLKKEGYYNVYILDRQRINRPNYFRGDICDYINIRDIFDEINPDVVFHFAAMVSRKECEETPVMSIESNVNGTLNILEACNAYNSRIIYAGSSEEYGDAYTKIPDHTVDEDTKFGCPTSFYAMTKRMSEELIQYYATYKNITATTTRFCMLYGEGEIASDYRSAITRFIDAAINNKPLTVHRDTERSWCHIDDAIDALINVLKREQTFSNSYEVYNVGKEEPISAEDLANKIVKLCNSKSKINIIPVEDTIIPIKRSRFDKMKSTFGWEAKIDLDEGLQRIIKSL